MATAKPRTVDDLRDQATEQASLLATGADWARMLRYLVHFREFGATGVLLILRHRPHATELATYEQWQSRGRQVQRGERGMSLPDPEDARRMIRAFDITQTGAPPAIGPLAHLRPSRHTADELLGALTLIAVRRGFAVRREEGPYSAVGSLPDRTITLHPALASEGACYALAHELAHVILHAAGFPTGTAGCHALRLVEAESTAFVVCRAAGLDINPFTFPPPPAWAGKDPRTDVGGAIHAAIQRIAATSTTLIGEAQKINDGRAWSPVVHRYLEQADANREPGERATPAEEAPPDPDLYAIHVLAERFFVDQLPRSWVPGYLAGRGLADALEDGAPWGIGYAPADWTSLVDHLRSYGYDDSQIIASGLGKRSRTGGLIDRFRDRAMIPVRTAEGRTIAFIGRANPENTPANGHPVPKYLNSPQTPIYTKGAVLYGLDIARSRLAAGAVPILVEGTLDAIAVASVDADHRFVPVAPSGTALTGDQVSALGDIVDLAQRGVIVAFDGDEAGQQAAVRAHGLLRPATTKIHRVVLPRGADPADILQTTGPDQLVTALSAQRPLAELVLDAHLAETGSELPWERRDRAAALIAGLVPADVAESVRHADTAGTGDPLSYKHVEPGLSARLLPATTLALIARAGEAVHLSATEMTKAVITALTECPGLKPRPESAAAVLAAREVPYGLTTIASTEPPRTQISSTTRLWPPARPSR